ncbi:hypothetical protein VM1G_11045 [Cytospora mali]|nr:hypothetical protein VM1G_11045 [Valsa mali]
MAFGLVVLWSVFVSSMAKFEAPTSSENHLGDTQATVEHTPGYVEARLAENSKEWRTAAQQAGSEPPCLGSQQPTGGATPSISSVASDFENLSLSLDPKVRLVFKHTESNHAINLEPKAAQQEIFVEPAGVLRRRDGPAIVKLMAFLQSRSEVKCKLTFKTICCEIFYFPNSDNVILVNCSRRQLSVESASTSRRVLSIRETTTLSPADWKLSNQHGTIDLRLLPRPYVLLIEEKTVTAAKRSSSDASLSQIAAKRSKGPAGSSTRALCRLDTPIPTWAGLNLEKNQVLKVAGAFPLQVEYSICRVTAWACKKMASQLYPAILDDGISKPEVVIVKVIKRATSENNDIKDAANAWSRELRAHRSIQHASQPYNDAKGVANVKSSPILSNSVDGMLSTDLADTHWQKDGVFLGDTTDTYRILTQTSSALGYLDQQGIVHNDIKPGNILYTRNPFPGTGYFPATPAGVMLIDFGLATKGDETMKGGTPWYLPPEFLNSKGGPGRDVFAFGVVMLYVMKRIQLPELWKEYPSWRVGDIEMRKWQTEVKNQAKALSPSGVFVRELKLCDLVRRMLAVTPQDRITSSELAKETESWKELNDSGDHLEMP